jgi:serine/threonine protein phosphatase PrpC
VTVLRSGSASDVGRVRKVNQDVPLEAPNLFAVADGMGGHVGGEVAARVAVEALLAEFSRDPTAVGLQGAFSRANRAVWQEGQDHSELRGMGTTLTAMALVGGADGRDILALANVGDSRAYVYTDRQIVQITADHSLAEERARHGEMTEAEAAVHPQRHILTRVLGVSTEVETDMWELHLRSGDRVVLCSDGLSNELDDADMEAVLAREPDPAQAAQQLVAEANEHGGSDNITVVVVDVLVGEEGDPPASVMTPLGAAAEGPAAIAAAATDAAPASASDPTTAQGRPVSDSLAKGARLGFTGDVPLAEGEVGRDQFFLDNTQAVPVARATLKADRPPRPRDPAPPTNESRRARRRRLGIPRRITFRVIAFIILVAAVPLGAFFAIRWYAYDNWYVSVQGSEVVIHQGHPGGVLWFEPRLIPHTGVKKSQILPTGLADIRSVVQEPTLKAAKAYVSNLHEQYLFLRELVARQKAAQKKALQAAASATTLPPPGPTTTVPAATTVPSSTVPPATTTVPVPATTTTLAG